jgi:hypothetical protein
MKKNIILLLALILISTYGLAQPEPAAGNWKTWLISSGKAYRLPAPASYKIEITQLLSRQQELTAADRQEIIYWNAGAPGCRWRDMMNALWITDTTYHGALANMLLGVSTYDATIAA